jgi:hypothetical protein
MSTIEQPRRATSNRLIEITTLVAVLAIAVEGAIALRSGGSAASDAQPHVPLLTPTLTATNPYPPPPTETNTPTPYPPPPTETNTPTPYPPPVTPTPTPAPAGHVGVATCSGWEVHFVSPLNHAARIRVYARLSPMVWGLVGAGSAGPTSESETTVTGPWLRSMPSRALTVRFEVLYNGRTHYHTTLKPECP